MRRDLTTRSIILEMRDRLEIGRQFESSSLSNVGFLSNGENGFLEGGMKLTGDEGKVDNIGDCGNKKGRIFFKKPGGDQI